MSPIDFARVKAVLLEVLECPAAERAEALDRLCGSDEALRGEVESLTPATMTKAATAAVVNPPLEPYTRMRTLPFPLMRGRDEQRATNSSRFDGARARAQNRRLRGLCGADAAADPRVRGVIQAPAWDDVVRAASRETASPVCDEVALLGLDGEIYRDPRSIPARVWKLVRHPIRVSEIHRRIVEEAGLDEEAARKEVLDALGQLRQAALIDVLSPAGR